MVSLPENTEIFYIFFLSLFFSDPRDLTGKKGNIAITGGRYSSYELLIFQNLRKSMLRLLYLFPRHLCPQSKTVLPYCQVAERS